MLGFLALLAAAFGGPARAHAEPSPVAAYSFDEGSGETATDSAGDHDGTIEGASWVSSGKYGSALEFDGENDLVSIADAADLDLTGSFTLEAWVRPDAFSAARPVISKVGFPEAGVGGYQLEGTSAGIPLGRVAASGTVKGVEGSKALPTEETWSHVALTSDGTTLRLYVNGLLEKKGEGLPAADTTAALKVGQGFGGWFDGLIDEVRLYDEMLSEDQIQLDRDLAVGLDQLPVAAYSFDEGSGTILGDSAGDHDGMIGGASWTSEGKYGSALDFDGVDDLVSVPDVADLDFTDSFTLEAWVRPDTAVNWTSVISKTEEPKGVESGYVLFARGSTEGPRGHVVDEDVASAVYLSEPLPLEAWSHIAFSSDGKKIRLYVDGTLKGLTNAVAAKATEADLLIGHWDHWLDTYFDGLIDEIRIYDEPISESQIQSDLNRRIQPPSPSDVTTSVLDTGSTSELVKSLPITEAGVETVVYSLEIPTVEAEETLRLTANLELTNDNTYDVTDSVRVVLGSNEADASGEVVVPWSSITHTPAMRHWTFPISGAYHATEELGTKYLKVIVKAQSDEAQANDTLTVQPNFGSLMVTRSTPALGPMMQPTWQLQAQIDPAPQLTTSIPVDSAWHRVITRKVAQLKYNDILDIMAQVEVHNTSNATVRLESKITRTITPTTTGSFATPSSTEQLAPDIPSARIAHVNHLRVTDPGKPYLNLSLRAVPISGTPAPLVVQPNAATLGVLRHTPSPGGPSYPLREGTVADTRGDASPDVSSIPFAVAGGSEKRVVASAPIYGGIWKGERIQARAVVTADLNGSSETTQILTRLILADSPTATTGTTIGTFSGDKVPPAGQLHTSVKEGIYVVPSADAFTKYINFVVYASQLNPEGSMNVPAASVSATRLLPSEPLNEGFEDGLDTDGLDSVFEWEYNGTLSASTDQAREGEKSLLVDMDLSVDEPGDGDIRRDEVRPPDQWSTGGEIGEERWYGFSVFFPEEFQIPRPDPVVYFDGLIDEVRLYDQTLTAEQIVDDMGGEYGQTPTPVAAYGFNEGSGTTAEDSAGSNDGTIVGASWTASGKIGSALDFDGNDEVSVPDNVNLDLSSAFTLEAWVHPASLVGALGSPVISKIDAPTSTPSGYLLRAAAVGNRPAGVAAASGTLATASGSGALPLEEWSHLALTSDESTLRLYVDGQLVKQVTAVTAPSTSAPLSIGASNYSMAMAGTWNIFTQFRHTHEGNLGCTEDPGGVPISFNARYYKAGAHTNPGASETATPTSADYIEIGLNGGEITADCSDTVKSPERYVLTKLQRGHWYDFVLHTRWTTEEGGPGNSVTEVWMDGEQVLGDQSTPIVRPTLSWRESLDQRNTGAHRQFGLYRGPSYEDPTSKLYIDAVRSGDSYEQVAPGQ